MLRMTMIEKNLLCELCRGDWRISWLPIRKVWTVCGLRQYWRKSSWASYESPRTCPRPWSGSAGSLEE